MLARFRYTTLNIMMRFEPGLTTLAAATAAPNLLHKFAHFYIQQFNNLDVFS